MSTDSTFNQSPNETLLASQSSSSNHQSEAQVMLDSFWQRILEEITNLGNADFKNQELPLARIKKIMKLDDDVKVMVNVNFSIFPSNFCFSSLELLSLLVLCINFVLKIKKFFLKVRLIFTKK